MIRNDDPDKNTDMKGRLCKLLDIGEVSIPKINRLMERLAELRQRDRVSDMLFILYHPDSLALGARPLNPHDVLKPLDYFERQGIHLYKSIRGGGLTYHWAGQFVCYPVLKLNHDEQNISDYMYRLEEVGIRTLRDLQVTAERRRDETAQIGLWHDGRKIASMGVHVSRWVTSFGFALNLLGDTEPTRFIRPCGLKNVQLTTVEEVTGNPPDREFVKQRLIGHFQDVFQRELIEENTENVEKVMGESVLNDFVKK